MCLGINNDKILNVTEYYKKFSCSSAQCIHSRNCLGISNYKVIN